MEWKNQETAKKCRIDLQKDDAFLKQKLGMDRKGSIDLDEADLAVLREGEDVFLWESPLAPSAEAAAGLARQAAADMAPAPGRAILASILYVATGEEGSLAFAEQISGPIQQMLPEDGTVICKVEVCGGQKGSRFLLVTSEGSAAR